MKYSVPPCMPWGGHTTGKIIEFFVENRRAEWVGLGFQILKKKSAFDEKSTLILFNFL